MSKTREVLVTILGCGCSILLVMAMDYRLFAHEAMSGWQYPNDCCSDKDCAEYPAENVKIEGDGFRLKEGEYIARTKARVSPDGRYHICRYQNRYQSDDSATTAIISPGSGICFWYPPMGM